MYYLFVVMFYAINTLVLKKNQIRIVKKIRKLWLASSKHPTKYLNVSRTVHSQYHTAHISLLLRISQMLSFDDIRIIIKFARCCSWWKCDGKWQKGRASLATYPNCGNVSSTSCHARILCELSSTLMYSHSHYTPTVIMNP